MEVASRGAQNGLDPLPADASLEPTALLDHLSSLVRITLGATESDLQAPGSLLSKAKKSDTIQRCSRFASDAQTALYVQKDIPLVEHVNGTNGTTGQKSAPALSTSLTGTLASAAHFIYSLSNEISSSSDTLVSIALIKRPIPLDPSTPIADQVQVIQLPGLATLGGAEASSSKPFEVLHSILHHALAPYFDANTKSHDHTNGVKSKYDTDSRSGVPSTKKKLAELELSLLHLQKNVEIPELHLTPPDVIQDVIKTAVKRGQKPSFDQIPPALLSDSRFLNELQNHVNGWIKSIQNITKLSKDPEVSSATQEINIWLTMETTLQNIELQLKSDGVNLTMEVLKHAKRYQATVSFDSDTGLKEATEKVLKYNLLMRDFPLDELLAATSLTKVSDALDSIFSHLNKKLRVSPYPIPRALNLVSAISGDLERQILSLVHGRSLMHLDYQEFLLVMDSAEAVFKNWDEHIKDFTNTARETVRRRNDKFIPIRIMPRHDATQERLSYIKTFRINHEQLQRTIVNVLGARSQGSSIVEEEKSDGAVIVEEIGDVDAVEEVQQAYASIRDVNVLDTTPEGTEIWAQAEATYNERTSRVENTIIARLRDRLATAKNSAEMFRVFSKFNALFVRPKIRGAISEYQTQLIDNVKADIASLHERFKRQYGRSDERLMAQVRDIPMISGAIIWARQIERQLDAYLRKVEDVLGKEWALHTEGQKLQVEGMNFRKKLDTRPIFESWLQDMTRRKVKVSGRLFGLGRNRAQDNNWELRVVFDNHVVTLFKEVRNLFWLQFSVPHAINTVAKEARRVYPFAVTLMDSTRTFTQTCQTIGEIPEVSMLLAGYLKAVQDLIVKGIPVKWESFANTYDLKAVVGTSQAVQGSPAFGRNDSKHVQFIREFSSAISVLQEKTDALVVIHDNVEKAITELATCPYEASAFTSRLDAVQGAVDQLNLESYSNLKNWVKKLNSRLEQILGDRLGEAMRVWLDSFSTFQLDAFQSSRREQSEEVEVKQIKPDFRRIVHELSMQNQVIFLDPPSDFARADSIHNFHSWLATICNLPTIKASRYQLRVTQDVNSSSGRFTYLPSLSINNIQTVYQAVEARIADINEYVDKWLQFQSLWDLQSDSVYDKLGDDLSQWLQILQEIRKSRSTFDNSESARSFGNAVVDYEQVQTKVAAKYDQWQHEVLQKFGARLAIRMREVYAELEKARRDLEGQSLDASSTAQAVSLITVVQQCKRRVQAWEPEVELFRKGQTTLTRQRYQFPQDWMYVDQIDHEWTILNDILARKVKVVEDQSDALRAKIIAEDKIVADKITDAVAQWNEEKPVSGNIAPDQASNTLSTFRSRLTKLKAESEAVAKAKEALDLPAGSETSLGPILEEVEDFTSVWASLSTIWQSLNELRETGWNNVQPRKVRQSIESLIKMTRDMPSRMRQYAAFEHIQNILKQLLKANTILTDLKSEAIKERHWIKIFKSLKPGKRYSALSMTLGDVYDLQLTSSEAIIRDVITQAQGELALEEFLKQVKDVWQNYTLDLINYQNKCRLIRGWDDLFAKCSEHLNSLQAMRHSPYYKEFEEDASSWEERLNRVHVLFDVWIDVQRQWVYLEGVFTGNADIKHLLPMESSRFQNINAEFFAILKKVNKSPYVLDVLNIAGVQKSLERLADLLNKIQKALGEYLERERNAFPRFYFIGDEDLLEMIGNSNDTLRIAKHFGKMFAGLSGLLMDEEQTTITGFTSKEGEEVLLKNPISVAQIPKINDWLAALETDMKVTLATLLSEAIDQFRSIFEAETIDTEMFDSYIQAYPAQVVVLATQVVWTEATEKTLAEGGQKLQYLFDTEVNILESLASTVLRDLDHLTRKKCEHLITECVHQRDTLGRLRDAGASSPGHHLWIIQMRYVYTNSGEATQRLRVKMSNADLAYGFEYLGVAERLVRTPLTDRCFLTLTQALAQRLGGSPYGPAGTGKTESVKALGVQLGRFTLVFCCDDTFDFQAMGRIFLGICRVGAWGCFDEFNRLEERILSAVSQQVQNIQIGLRKAAEDPSAQTELVGRQLKVHDNTGIFITMNPGYAGRSNLPDNLKKLFRSVAMSKPDKELIAEVMLYSQGFKQAKKLSKQTVPFFDQCKEMFTKQAHYDFGLRALKSVLVSSGGLKRVRITGGEVDVKQEEALEPQILVQSLRETIAPKLVREDVESMKKIEAKCFPGVEYVAASLVQLEAAIRKDAEENQLVVNETWMTKILQLYQIQGIHHGVMMVGNSGSGKSTVWRTLLRALQQVEGVEGVCHIIDSKVMSKEALYGNLDSTTREWSDGLFTGILRKVVDNLRGEDSKRHWIIFDGDVDPEWVENLNSVLDDNKLLTLPNGERLSLPPNVRIMFEVETLKYATLATVSRCGMIWFNEDTVTPPMIVSRYLQKMQEAPFEDLDEDTAAAGQAASQALSVQKQVVTCLQPHLGEGGLLNKAFERAEGYNHIMEFTQIRSLNTLFSLLNKACRTMIEYDLQHEDFPLEPEQINSFISKKLLLALVWSFTGDCPLSDRMNFGGYLAGLTTVDTPALVEGASLIDFDVPLPRADWAPWQSQVPSVDVNTHSVTQTDVVIPTLDTVRHEDVLYSWLAEHKPLILCGPPGSGKTMTLFSALRKLPNMEVVGLNFSSATTPDLIIKTFDQYCEYRKTLNGVIMSPSQVGRWLVVFCDEINLPAPDKYGTQRAITFLRQLIEHNGFWRTSDKQWVTLDRIQFVGACNPPTDAGRTPLAARFLRHSPLIMVDYPGQQSLQQIYGTFNSAVLKIVPNLRGQAEALTKAMVQFYLESQTRFTPKIQPHYVYSPRELTRWVRGIYEAIRPLETLSVDGLVRIWAHEALRLFQDRLVAEDERKWTSEATKRIAAEHFPNVDEAVALKEPILFSNWLSKNYVPVEREQLRDFVKARLKTFCEEEVDVPLILFNDVLEHVLRIDRVFRQPQGHLILIGVSGSGKTTLSRFVAWMNGLKVFQIKVHGRYSAEDFDDDLRDVLRRTGCKGEKLCFIMDESNVLDSGFLERMNTLLANAEVPGLFEGDEYAALMTACREGAQRQGLLLDSQEELYKWFTQQIVKNLHVVFTMNPPEDGLSSKAATSPALFNRCVLNWFGDWSDQALYQVGTELTQSVDLDRQSFTAPATIPLAYRDLQLPANHRDAVVNAMVHVHHSLHNFNDRLKKQQGRTTFLTPRHYLDFVAQYVKLYNEKREDLEEQQRHLNVGLDKLKDTVEKVTELRASLGQKKRQLERKEKEANDKLQIMVGDQQAAESTKAASLEIRENLDKQEIEVTMRKKEVKIDLDKAEPAVLEAQEAVGNIKKQQLTEVRSMAQPPATVRMALEAVCTLLGHRVENNWKAIQAVLRDENFTRNIVGYDNERQMTKALRTRMQKEYLTKEDFTFERVNRASKACGPLVQWVTAQVNFSAILDRVGPLREEAEQLEEAALTTKAEATAVENKIEQLERSIAQYKTEYAALISETGAIKAEMERVEFKVNRSVKLLDSLASERIRWDEGSKSFETQIGTIVGDVLIAAAFLAYGGLYDQQYRKSMIEDWTEQLSMSGISLKAHNEITEFLSTADDRVQWQRNGLPVDDLCTENAIVLKRFNRYPLIIDPSGRATEFLQNESSERKLTITSFLDDSFVKQLESSLRFGNPILIQDAEHLDPVLNHVLNKEYQKTGGRVLIQLGKQEIDFSPAFQLYLSTRDPSAMFPPDVCSRTTFVNFTVTQSSLQTQSLNDVVKSERPDVDERRSNLVKMQGEFNIHLRGLEKRLLQALNESRGNILDDDLVIETLETLKTEAADISKKMADTQGVMQEVEAITVQYSKIAKACSAVFSILEQLHHLNHFYQFSLQYFLDIFKSVLHSNPNLKDETNHSARAEIILHDLFVATYHRTALSLLQQDRVTLAMLLTQAAPYPMDKAFLDVILDSKVEGRDMSSVPEAKAESMPRAMRVEGLKGYLPNVSDKDWEAFATEEMAENYVPQVWESSTTDLDRQLRSLLMIKFFRLDRFVPAAEKFVTAVFGKELLNVPTDLKQVVDQASSMTPIALCSSPGFDASYKVDSLVEREQVQCSNIAMGSNEALGSADKAISNAAANGSWVLVKNVHLTPSWLQSLEKRLNALKPHEDFRLFISMESSPKIPVNLLRASRVLTYEQPAGIRANMKDSLSSLSSRKSDEPVEKARLYLLLSFLHAVIQERLRYAPKLGWTGFWEFNDADYECAAYIIDTWLANAAQGRTNIAPANIPWDLLRILITETYGGKVDNENDFTELRQLVETFMTPAAFNEGHKLVQSPEGVNGSDAGLTVPESTRMVSMMEWVSALPEREPPTYLGLPANAEKILLVGHGKDMIGNLARITEILDEGEQLME